MKNIVYICKQYLEDLELEVNDYFDSGYVPFGGVHADSLAHNYFQAMIKKDALWNAVQDCNQNQRNMPTA